MSYIDYTILPYGIGRMSTCFGDIDTALEDIEDEYGDFDDFEGIEVHMDSSTWEHADSDDTYPSFKYECLSDEEKQTAKEMQEDLAPWIKEMYPQIQYEDNGNMFFPLDVPFLVCVLTTSFYRCKYEHSGLYKMYKFFKEQGYHTHAAYFGSLLKFYSSPDEAELYSKEFLVNLLGGKYDDHQFSVSSTTEHVPFRYGTVSQMLGSTCRPFRGYGPLKSYHSDLYVDNMYQELMDTKDLDYSKRTEFFMGQGGASFVSQITGKDFVIRLNNLHQFFTSAEALK